MTHHGFLTLERVVISFATAKDIATNGNLIGSFCYSSINVCGLLSTDVDRRISKYVSQFTTAIDITIDMGTIDGCRGVTLTNHVHRSLGDDVDNGISGYITSVTTTIDFTNGSNLWCNITLY